jgi:hypothetical protein
VLQSSDPPHQPNAILLAAADGRLQAVSFQGTGTLQQVWTLPEAGAPQPGGGLTQTGALLPSATGQSVGAASETQPTDQAEAASQTDSPQQLDSPMSTDSSTETDSAVSADSALLAESLVAAARAAGDDPGAQVAASLTLSQQQTAPQAAAGTNTNAQGETDPETAGVQTSAIGGSDRTSIRVLIMPPLDQILPPIAALIPSTGGPTAVALAVVLASLGGLGFWLRRVAVPRS